MICCIHKLLVADKRKIALAVMAKLWISALVLRVISLDDDNCQLLFERGRLSLRNVWQPTGCMLHQYNKSDVDRCARELGELRIDFVGDSRLRQVYEQLATVVSGERVVTGKAHSDLQSNSNQSATFVNFFWYPRVNDSMLELYKSWVSSKRPIPAVLVTGSASWTIKVLNASAEAAQSFRGNLSKIATSLKSLSKQTRVVWMMQDPVVESKLNPSRVMITNQQMDLYNTIAAETLEGVATLWQSSRQVAQSLEQDTEDGLHRGVLTMEQDVHMLLNMLCNDVIPVTDGTCCKPAPSVTWPTVAIGLFFMACAVATLVLWLKQDASGDSTTPVSVKVPVSAFDLLMSLAQLGLMLGYIYTCDRTTIFGKENKHYSWPVFLVPVVAIGVLCVWKTKAVDDKSISEVDETGLPKSVDDHRGVFIPVSQVDNEPDLESADSHDHSSLPACQYLLPIQQTEEWKGWMQLVILVYHMTGASQVCMTGGGQSLTIYMHIRLLVSAYLFITGFVQFESVCRRGCPSPSKMAHTVLRYNLLVMLLCVLMTQPYQSYYFVPLVTFHYVLVNIILMIPPQLTHDMASQQPYLLTYVKLFILCIVLTILDNSESLFEAIFGNVVLRPLFITADNSLHEWHFRWRLDRYSSLFGVACACVWRHSQLHTSSVERLCKTQWLVCICLSCTGLVSYYALLLSACQSKAQCNELHPFVTVIPIISFLYLRNSVPILRGRYSVLAAYCGHISLELFITQYHIWLAADTHGVLVLVHDFPLLNLMLTSIIFIVVSDNINLITKRIIDTLDAKSRQPVMYKWTLVCIVVLSVLVYLQGLL